MAIGDWRRPQHPWHWPEGFDLQTRFCKIWYDVLLQAGRQAGWLFCLWVGTTRLLTIVLIYLLVFVILFVEFLSPHCIEIVGCTNYKWGTHQWVCRGPYRIVCRLTHCLAALLIYDLIIVGQVVAMMIVLNSTQVVHHDSGMGSL